MVIVDREQSRWYVGRRWLPWRRRFLFGRKLGGASVFDGSNDPVDLAVGLVIVLILALPSALELVLAIVLLPFAVLLRLVGLLRTIVEVRCTGRAVGTHPDGTTRLQTTGTLESWDLPVSGFGRASRLTDAVAALMREQGRSADVMAFAAHWSA